MTEQSNKTLAGGAMKESLSALMDGQASDMELRRVLKAAASDAEVRAVWSRYQMAGNIMRGELAQAPRVDLSASIRMAIDAEESLAPRSGWLQSVSKVAIAASVAAAMVVTTQFVGTGGADTPMVAGNDSAPTTELRTPPVSLPAGFHAPSLSARTVSSHPRMPAQQRYYPAVSKVQSVPAIQVPSPQVQAYLQRVMEVHAANAALNSGRGIMPYARVPAAEITQP